MNKYYNYDSMYTWDDAVWEDRMGYIGGLVKWIVDNYKPYYNSTGWVIDDSRWKDFNDPAYYSSNTCSIDVPEELKYWEEKGIRFECRHLGGTKWVSMVPTKGYIDRQTKIPALIVLHEESYEDNKWPMRTIEYYHDYNVQAAENGFIVVYAVTEGVDLGQIPNIILETTDLFPTDIDQIYLDVSPIVKMGKKLSDIKEFAPKDPDGNDLDPDSLVVNFGPTEIPAIDISKLWQKKDGMYPFLVARMHNSEFDYERFIHSQAGEKMANATELEFKYDTAMDPGMLKHWDDMGAKYEEHDYLGERWITLAPKSAYEDKDTKLPLMIIMQEVPYCNDHLVLTAFSQYYDYCRLAAQGDLILLMFAKENFDLNDILADIVEEAKNLYPIDASRVYISGHSHNGYYSLHFAIRHRELITAVATLGNTPGLPAADGKIILGMDGKPKTKITFDVPPEQVDYMSTYDMPLVNIAGYCETSSMFPANEDNHFPEPGVIPSPGHKAEVRIENWQRRLYFSNCEVLSAEEIRAASQSPDRTTRLFGIPSDKTDVLYIDGAEHYIADIKNKEGKYHLRMIAMENMPHIPTPMMNTLAWSYVRGFARDPETHEIIELY